MTKNKHFEKIKGLWKAIYEIHSAGGALHIVLDDGNMEDDYIVWCVCNPINKIKNEEERKLYFELALLLLTLTEAERYEIYGQVWEYDSTGSN